MLNATKNDPKVDYCFYDDSFTCDHSRLLFNTEDKIAVKLKEEKKLLTEQTFRALLQHIQET